MINKFLDWVWNAAGGWKFWGIFTALFFVEDILNAIALVERGGSGEWAWFALITGMALFTGFMTGVKWHLGRGAVDDE